MLRQKLILQLPAVPGVPLQNSLEDISGICCRCSHIVSYSIESALVIRKMCTLTLTCGI